VQRGQGAHRGGRYRNYSERNRHYDYYEERGHDKENEYRQQYREPYRKEVYEKESYKSESEESESDDGEIRLSEEQQKFVNAKLYYCSKNLPIFKVSEHFAVFTNSYSIVRRCQTNMH
jgi:hypothetical protein